ncbi:hypothetical protein FOMPIDRAFT_1056683 [Fomitopsis schrenkii]|uniref:Uncharacterized protein n=1 Tax=Fomitopsis schrenkii TaxID=2126942 RepID=S8ES82_FOMSC|nr:hypothetical protein FOMPIDRAFT_1056683 [Fomitopsis schrenkii]
MATLPRILLRIRADDPKFAQAYGGTVVAYSRPAMVTKIDYDGDRNITGIWYAPFTSSLDTNRCDISAWAPVDWCLGRVSVPTTLLPGVGPLRLPLRAFPPFHARPSHVWVKDRGVFVSAAEWRVKVQCGEAENWDWGVVLTQADVKRCRKACKAIREYYDTSYVLVADSVRATC